MPQLDKEALRKQTEKNCELLKSEEFLSQLDAIFNTPEGQRVEKAAKLLTPDALREAGVDLPEGLHVSSRYFEPDLKRPLQFGNVEGINSLISMAENSPGALSKMKERDPAGLQRLNQDAELQAAKVAACGGIGAGAGVSFCACFGS